MSFPISSNENPYFDVKNQVRLKNSLSDLAAGKYCYVKLDTQEVESTHSVYSIDELCKGHLGGEDMCNEKLVASYLMREVVALKEALPNLDEKTLNDIKIIAQKLELIPENDSVNKQKSEKTPQKNDENLLKARDKLTVWNELKNLVGVDESDLEFANVDDNALFEKEKEFAVWIRENETLLQQHKLLYLDSLNLHWLPPEIGLLTHLEELNLSLNQLSSLPPEIGRLTQLKKLFLYRNSLKSFPEECKNFSQLQCLVLSGNELTSLPKGLLELPELKELNLSSNFLTAIPQIKSISKLKHLNLNSNNLKSLPKGIENLQSLRTLNLNLNHLTELPSEIGQLLELKELELSTNDLKSIPKEIRNLSKLKLVDIRNNLFTSLPKELDELKDVKLFVSGNPLVKIEKKELDPSLDPSSSVEQRLVFSARKFVGRLRAVADTGTYTTVSLMEGGLLNDFRLFFDDPAFLPNDLDQHINRISSIYEDIQKGENKNTRLKMCCWDFCLFAMFDCKLLSKIDMSNLCRRCNNKTEIDLVSAFNPKQATLITNDNIDAVPKGAFIFYVYDDQTDHRPWHMAIYAGDNEIIHNISWGEESNFRDSLFKKNQKAYFMPLQDAYNNVKETIE